MGGDEDERISLFWVPGGRRHNVPEGTKTFFAYMVVVSGWCPMRAYTSALGPDSVKPENTYSALGFGVECIDTKLMGLVLVKVQDAALYSMLRRR